MNDKSKYNFNEKKEEYSRKQEKNIPVWKSPKFEESKKKAIELLEKKEYGLTENDFWILMNETKSGKMGYTGLIISHNGCLKINDKLPEKDKFKPSCASRIKDEQGLIVMQYINDEQGIFEYGEISPKNCKNDYPNAMVLKRLQDRVILKNSKIAFDGIYSESESEEFGYNENYSDTTKKIVNKKVAVENKELDKVFNELKNKIKESKTDEELEKIVKDNDFKKKSDSLDEVRKKLLRQSYAIMKKQISNNKEENK